VLFTSLGDSYTLLAAHGLTELLSSLPALESLSLRLASGEHDAHLLTDESALALAYGAPRLRRLDWRVGSVSKKQGAPPPPPPVAAAQLTESGVAVLLGMEGLEALTLHAPVALRQAVSGVGVEGQGRGRGWGGEVRPARRGGGQQ